MANIIVIILLVVVIALAIRTIYKNNKNGDSCAGCPYAANCRDKSGCNNNHHTAE